MTDEGLFYFYLTFARMLPDFGRRDVVDKDFLGNKLAKLAQRGGEFFIQGFR